MCADSVGQGESFSTGIETDLININIKMQAITQAQQQATNANQIMTMSKNSIDEKINATQASLTRAENALKKAKKTKRTRKHK